MLPKNQRITKELVEKTIRQGKSFQTEYLTLKTLFTQESNSFGFVVSKKVSKKAVERNLLKRRGRYIIRKYLANFKKGILAVFIFKQNTINLSFKDLEKEFYLLFQKSNILNK